MAQLIVRNIEEELVRELKLRAARARIDPAAFSSPFRHLEA